MSGERESQDKVVLVPLKLIKPLPFNVTVIDDRQREMLKEEMRLESKGLQAIDPILLRRLTPDEVEECKQEYPTARYEIVDGHTRFRLAKENNWTEIKARILDVSREQAYEINYRKNKERGTVDPLAEALYFRRLARRGMKPSDIAELFSMSEADVLRIMARAVVSREAQDVIMDKFRALGKPVPGKLLKAIASVPAEKQPVLAETILDGRLKASQVERAKEAVLRGAPKEEAIRLAKAQEEKAEAYKFEGAGLAPPEQKPSARETGEVTCPKCGARAKVYWKLKQILWE